MPMAFLHNSLHSTHHCLRAHNHLILLLLRSPIAQSMPPLPRRTNWRHCSQPADTSTSDFEMIPDALHALH